MGALPRSVSIVDGPTQVYDGSIDADSNVRDDAHMSRVELFPSVLIGRKEPAPTAAKEERRLIKGIFRGSLLFHPWCILPHDDRPYGNKGTACIYFSLDSVYK